MEYLNGSLEEITNVLSLIETGLGINSDSIIKHYADVVQGKDGSYAIPIIQEVKKYLTGVQIQALLPALPDGYCQEIIEVTDEITD
jgi:hypothetical protein